MGSPYEELHPALRRTIVQTFLAIQSGAHDAEGRAATAAGVCALQNTLRGSAVDAWAALDRVPSSILNLYAMIHARVTTVLPGFWDEVLWIRWAFFTTSMGFQVTYRDPTVARRLLQDASHTVGKPLGHDSRVLSWYFHPGSEGWRELRDPGNDSGNDCGQHGPGGLHFLLGDRPDHGLIDQIHLDPSNPYRQRRSDGTCRPTLDRVTLMHLWQVVVTRRPIVSPFDALPTALEAARARPGIDATALEAIADDWRARHRLVACRGWSGWQTAMAWTKQAEGLGRTRAPGAPEGG